MIHVVAPDRGNDPLGAGHFGAPRGSRTHTGHDVAVWPGSMVLSLTAGMVTDLGFAYTKGLGAFNGQDPFRIITVVADDDHEIRYYYVDPVVEHGELVKERGRLGFAQDLWRRYPPKPGKIMTPHVHIQIKNPAGELIDPKDYHA